MGRSGFNPCGFDGVGPFGEGKFKTLLARRSTQCESASSLERSPLESASSLEDPSSGRRRATLPPSKGGHPELETKFKSSRGNYCGAIGACSASLIAGVRGSQWPGRPTCFHNNVGSLDPSRLWLVDSIILLIHNQQAFHASMPKATDMAALE